MFFLLMFSFYFVIGCSGSAFGEVTYQHMHQ